MAPKQKTSGRFANREELEIAVKIMMDKGITISDASEIAGCSISVINGIRREIKKQQ